MSVQEPRDRSFGDTESEDHLTLFATHSSLGVVDLGATKTVIGSQLVPGLLKGLSPEARQTVRRCPCKLTFRFGNQGVLQSEQALVIPIHGLLLKVAVVPGSTPFLLSNTLLRAIGAVIDTSRQVIHATKISKTIPIQLTEKGLFLLDLNDLMDATGSTQVAETHQVSTMPKECTEPAATVASSETEMTTHDQFASNVTMPSQSSHNMPPHDHLTQITSSDANKFIPFNMTQSNS
jgi:hypothetical protein